jgi:hypothetical protein
LFVTVNAARTAKLAVVPSGTVAVAAPAGPAAEPRMAAVARTAAGASRNANEDVMVRIVPVMVVTMGFSS